MGEGVTNSSSFRSPDASNVRVDGGEFASLAEILGRHVGIVGEHQLDDLRLVADETLCLAYLLLDLLYVLLRAQIHLVFVACHLLRERGVLVELCSNEVTAFDAATADFMEK